MLAGLTVTIAYMVLNAPAFRHFWAMDPSEGLWWGVQPISAGIFGVPAGFAAIALMVLARRCWPPTAQATTAQQSLSGPGL